MLIALLAIVAGKGSIAWGMLLLLYSIGHGVLTIFAGTTIGFVCSMTQNEKYGRASQWVRWCMGAVILLMGSYMFYLAF